MNHIIEVQNVSKTFQQHTVIDKLSFHVKQGEIFGFLGPSGSGKTTTIKMLTAQLANSKGHIQLFNEDVSELKKSKKRSQFGVLTDNSGLYKNLTIEENLQLYCGLYDINKSEIDYALSFVNLTEHRKKKVKELSKGMTQRVTLARTILHKPKLLFLDEPTSALDPVNAKHIHDGLLALNQAGTTIFLTTHNMQEANDLCDRVAFLNQGKIQLLGEPEQLKRKYSDQTIHVTLLNGESHILKQTAADGQQLAQWFATQQIDKIAHHELSLGDIFRTVTGGNLL